MKNKLKYDAHTRKVYTLEEYIKECYGGLPNESMLEEQFNDLPDVQIGYDSYPDTLEHIKKVNQYLIDCAKKLLDRAKVHDDSKLKDPEKSVFDAMTPKLKGSTYGSEEYNGFLKNMKVALDHHYANNSHHPEHYKNGLNDMDLFDLIEMLMDWKAASERHSNGDIRKSLEISEKRFGISPQVKEILLNTIKKMGW